MRILATTSFALATLCTLSPMAHAATLQAYWTFENDVLDQSGNANDGTLQNGATFAASMAGLGQALSLDGIDDYVSTTDIDLTNVTIAAWVNVNAGTQGYVVSKNFSGGTVPYHLNIGGAAFGFLQGTAFYDGTWRSTSQPPSAGTFVDVRGTGWRHVAGTYDGTTLKYFVDGVLQQSSTSGSGNLPVNDHALDIGRYGNDTAFLGGLIDELRVYEGALTDAEVAALVPEPSSLLTYLCGFLAVGLLTRIRQRKV